MAIQEMNKAEIEVVSGGILGLDLGSLLGGLPVVGSLLGTVKSLLATVTGVVSGLPIVGGLLGGLLGTVTGLL